MPTPLTRPAGQPQVVTFGEAMCLLITDDGLPLGSANRFRRTLAGSEANVAVALSRLGHPVAYATRLGEDPLGRSVARALRGEGVALTATHDPDRGTGILVRDADQGRGRTDVCYGRADSAASVLGPSDLPLHDWESATIVHLTGLTAALSETAGEAVVAAVQRLRATGVTVCVDPNLRRRVGSPELFAKRMSPLRGSIDIAVGSAEELCLLAGVDQQDLAIKELLDTGVRLVVVKKGAAGSWATDGTDNWSQPALPATVVDPVGAGDAFVAGLLSGLLDGVDPAAALHRGATIAAACVAVMGDIEGLPHRGEIEHRANQDQVVR